MDVVYPLKRGVQHAELRYSLRSLKNLPHDRVFLVGGLPDWATGVEHIQVDRRPTKYKDAAANIAAACNDPRVSDPFILMNDDFFVMKPIDQVPVLNRGRVRDVEQTYRTNGIASKYLAGMIQTREELEFLGYEDPLSFELHVPMVVHKQMRLKAIEMGARFPVWHARTAYGALARLEGETIEDVKIHDRDVHPDHNQTFLSTSDTTFVQGPVGTYIRAKFPYGCQYESQ